MDIDLLVGIQFGEALAQSSKGDQLHSLDVRDLMLVRFANVDDQDIQLRIVERLFHLFHAHLVWIGSRRAWRWFGDDPAKLLIIDQLPDGGILSAERALRIFP